MVPLLLLPLLWGGSLQEAPDFELQVPESVTVQEGLCVHVSCSFSYPTGFQGSSNKLYTYWYRYEDGPYYGYPVATSNPQETVKRETKDRFLLGNPWDKNCSLTIRDARRSDTGTYFFRMQRGYIRYNYQDKLLNLQVTALTEKPHIHFLEPLECGRPTQLTCSLPGSCKGGRPLTFSWAGAAVDSLNPQTLSSSVVTFTPRFRDHGTSLTCLVKREWPRLITQRTIQLNVSYAPQNLTMGRSLRNVTAFEILQTTSLSILEGEVLHLRCVADSNPPAQLSWFQGSPALNATPISSTEILELPRVGTAEEGEFTCQAQNRLGSQSVSLRLSVLYPPRLLGPSCSWEDQGLTCSCSSRAQPAPSLRWKLGEELLEGNRSEASYTVNSRWAGPWANSSLSLSGGLSAGLRLSCEARNVHGAQSAALLLLPGKSVSQVGVVPAALGGAGATALLALCVCLISFCIVKALRKQAAGRPKVTGDEDPVMGTATWGSQEKLGPDMPPDQALPDKDAPPLGEQQELYYANLRFYGMKLREPQDQEATSTYEYSEIRTTRK